jgi:tRNA-specific 2-thiouridylase
MLSADRLEKGIFPLGGYTKFQVKQAAEREQLEPLEKKESQDICFIHHGDTGRFIARKTGLTGTKGNIVKSDGTVMGEHDGVFKFTVGQRRKINCPGPQPYYVKTIDPQNNTLVIGTKDEILKKSFYIDSFNRISSDLEFPFRAVTKIRYNHPGARSIVVKEGERYKVEFEEPQHAVAPGQTAVFYKNDEVLGGGIIQ